MHLFWRVVFVSSCLVFSRVTFTTANANAEEIEDDYDDYSDFEDDSNNGSLHFTKELKNLTRDVGKMVRLVCEVKNVHPNAINQTVTFRWYKFSAPIERDKRITITKKNDKIGQHVHSSSLKIKDLEVTDKAEYECVASNGIDKIKSIGVLTVLPEKWINPSSDVPSYKSVFDDKTDQSKFTDLTTFLPNSDFKSHNNELFSTIADPISPELKGSRIGFEGGGLFDADKQMSVALAYNASEKLCQLYTGSRCRHYLQNRYVFVQPPYTQKAIEAKVENAFLVVSQSQDISTSCNKFAQPSLCFSAFPLCDPLQTNSYQENFINRNGYFSSVSHATENPFRDLRNKLHLHLQRICKEDCILLETELCSKEYAIAKRHPVIGQILELEECENIPNGADHISKGNCLRLGVDQSQDVNEDDTCYWDDGATYRGTKDTSATGSKCLRWSRHFSIKLLETPEIMTHNYCRNPEGQESEPYCFIDQNKKELCGVPKCIHVFSLYIGVSLLLLIICAVIAYLCYRRKYKKTRNIQNLNISPASKNIYGNPGPNSPIELNSLLPSNIPPQRNPNSKVGFENVPQYSHKELVFVQELGEGAFGKVYKGELKTKTGKVFVAIKSLKENASAKTQADFQREIELISELKHPNIICLLGVVTKQEPMCMLFEFMSEGDLHEFLITNSPNEGNSLSQVQFLHIAIQIAQGMEYLAENHYVHRDLAARNCLVSKELVVKISDFGLSRDMYSCDYYRVQSKSLLPVRWMPPESILYGKFTTESDVWSYGVVLWEIYSYGLQPYYGYNNQEVINMIRARKLLPCPDVCPSYCYSLMVECWAELAVRRPSFAEISHRLRVWKQNGCSSGAYFKNPEVYTNMHNKSGHSSKSSHATSDSQTPCTPPPALLQTKDHTDRSECSMPPLTWERKNPSGRRLNDSRSSLASASSRSSSVGNKTQSTSLSVEHGGSSAQRKKRKAAVIGMGEGEVGACPTVMVKDTVVSCSDGENFETKLT